MFQIPCPNCGLRDVSEFRFGGEALTRPQSSASPDWTAYVYHRQNLAGVQAEWWYHRFGCRRWFKARRDTITNEVLEIL